MSAARVEKLRALLARVERRRAEPPLVSLPAARSVESANTNLGASAAEAPVAAPRTPPTQPSLPPAPSSLPPPSSMPPPARDAALRSPIPPPPPRSEPPALRPRGPSSTIPPLEPGSSPPRAPTEVLPAAPTRIAPSAPLPFDAAVRVASSPRIDTPKTFGELLELSLSLRPK